MLYVLLILSFSVVIVLSWLWKRHRDKIHKLESQLSLITLQSSATFGLVGVLHDLNNLLLAAKGSSFSMKRKGSTVNLVDCYIAVLSVEHGCGILTLDDHFKVISKFMKLEMVS